ncbi:MAG: hypothetical protein WDM84_07185 [Bauldia sp.]
MKTLTEVVVKSHRLELLHRIADAYRTTGLFNSIIPTPPDFKSHPREWQMEWMLENWNTLHEIIQNDDWVSITAPGVLSVRIMTMWNCPFPFLDKLVELGCDIHGRTATTRPWIAHLFDSVRQWRADGAD